MDDRFSYDGDFLIWTERQASALRALAAGSAGAANELDLEHVAEEIEDLGKSELNAVRSYIRNIFIHLIKAACEPDSPAIPHGSVEARAFHGSMMDRITPAMHARLELPQLWQRARDTALDDLAAYGRPAPAWLPVDCPFLQEDIAASRLSFAALAARIGPPAL